MRIRVAYINRIYYLDELIRNNDTSEIYCRTFINSINSVNLFFCRFCVLVESFEITSSWTEVVTTRKKKIMIVGLNTNLSILNHQEIEINTASDN